MIQRLVLVLVCQAAVLAFAAGPKPTTITCRVHNYTGSAVDLCKVENGEARSMGFRRPGVGDTCMFTFSMEKEGVYFLRKRGPHQEMFNYVIYLKPGDNKLVDVYYNKIANDFDSCTIEKPNAETLCLQKWCDLLNGMYKLGANRTKRDQFIGEYERFIKEASVLKNQNISPNRYFKHVFAAKVDADTRYIKAAAFFNYGSRMNAGYDSTETHRPFYQSLAGQKFCDATILHSEHGLELVKYTLGYNLFKKMGSGEQLPSACFVEKAKSICSDSVRRAYVLNKMQGITNYDQFKAEIEPFKQLLGTLDSKGAYQKKEDELTVYAKGTAAYNFSLKDTKDKVVSLSDFKGKVVVLDIWAMWCAPCLNEKPLFSKIEEEYKGRDDILFLGISVDGSGKKEAWKDFVAKKGWQNIEMLSEPTESIMKYYKIEGIPRFMIFDREGKIVTTDAPRPSSPDFKKLIDQTLKATDRATKP
jgi:thiol-disulfide isomerase/thioredoxin